MTAKIDLIEESKLKWPDGAERTRIKDRESKSAWKKTWREYSVSLGEELQRMGATSMIITRSGDERLDPGVAVWWSMKKEDFSWQQGLGIDTPAPTLSQIDEAYRAKAMKCHPDRPGGDTAMFKQITDWRDAAKAWVTGTHGHNHDFVLAIDKFNEARLNLCALKSAIAYIRGLDRIGAPSVLQQTLSAFRAKLVVQTGGSNETTA